MFPRYGYRIAISGRSTCCQHSSDTLVDHGLQLGTGGGVVVTGGGVAVTGLDLVVLVGLP
ncbi:hypothetical protein Tco_0515539, partial [Tanacetum coccineum]